AGCRRRGGNSQLLGGSLPGHATDQGGTCSCDFRVRQDSLLAGEERPGGAVAMLDRAWAVPTPEREPEPSPNRHQRRMAKTAPLKAIRALRVGKLPRRDSNPRPVA